MFKVTLVRQRNFTSSEETKLLTALMKMEIVFNSKEFELEILNHSSFDTKERFNNKEIYNLIFNGDEIYTEAGIDNEADMDITLEGSKNSEKPGRTFEDRIYTYYNYFTDESEIFLAGHYAHEYCHLIGFKDPANHEDKKNNVPYEVGRIVREILEKVEKPIAVERLTPDDLSIAEKAKLKKKIKVKKDKASHKINKSAKQIKVSSKKENFN